MSLINYKFMQEAKCPCGWEGTLGQCPSQKYNSPPEDWAMLQGRRGTRYFCPKCDKVVRNDVKEMN